MIRHPRPGLAAGYSGDIMLSLPTGHDKLKQVRPVAGKRGPVCLPTCVAGPCPVGMWLHCHYYHPVFFVVWAAFFDVHEVSAVYYRVFFQ
jgi:hypothetical protein